MLLLDNSGSMRSTIVPDNFRSLFSTTLTPANAYQSPDANRLYYDPRVLYTPRVNADGTFFPAGTETNALTDIRTWSGNAAANGVFYVENCGTANCSQFLGPEYGGTIGAFTDTLTVNLCTTTAAGVCTAIQTYTLPSPANSTTFVANAYVPKSADRTDCIALAGFCTWSEERQNALNWQIYYSTRIKATLTATGQAFSDTKYLNKFRLGYGRMNALRVQDKDGEWSGGSSPDDGGLIKRGVRPFQDDASLAAPYKTERSDFYTWLYQQTAFNGTPSNRLLEAAGVYFTDATSTGPWSASPIIGSAKAQLACRRSNAVMFSDGAYNDVPTDVNNVDNGVFTSVPNSVHNAFGNNGTFTYSVSPSKTATYVAYPDSNKQTFADTAMRYWMQDLRPDLDDIVSPVAGNPAFWQHMVFYSIGFGVRGSVSNADVAAYNENYTKGNASTLNWGVPAANTITAINDYIHAAYTGRGKFYSVSSAKQVKKAFDDVLSRTAGQSGSDAGIAVADTNNALSTLAGELKYVPNYSVLESTGDITAYQLNATGNVVNPNSPVWIASRNIPDADVRNLVSISGISTGTALTGTFTALPADIQTAMGTGANDSYLNYLRGASTGIDGVSGDNYRLRTSLFGSIVNSPPAYVRGELNMGYTTSFVVGTLTGITTYGAYTKAKANNSLGALFAPANDGVVHALDPKTGAEIMGYMPRAALPKVKNFAQEPYEFQYVLDGPIQEGDIYSENSSTPSKSAWKSIVVGTGGRGGKFVYAMNMPVKSTVTGTITAAALTKNDLLWEISSKDADFADLGNILNPPQSGVLSNGRWVVIFGNGYYSPSGEASIYIVDALSGALIQRISTNVGTSADPNGMGGITLVRGYSREIVAVLGGDKKGNMWKFDLLTPGAGKLAFASNKPLFTSINNKPFSGAPAWRPLQGGMLVVAATGLLVEDTDPADTSTQTVYGVLDKTPLAAPEDTAKFLAPADTAKLQLQTSTLVVGATNTAASFYKVSKNAVDYTTQSGWRLDLTYEAGQRSIADVNNFYQTVLIATVVPPAIDSTIESCPANQSAPGFVYLLDADTGGNPDVGLKALGKGSGFDVDGDGLADGYGVAKISGFPRGSVIAQDQIGPRTESVLKKGDDNIPCDGTSLGGTLIGVGNTALQLNSQCGGGFLRSWRQLLNPPLIK